MVFVTVVLYSGRDPVPCLGSDRTTSPRWGPGPKGIWVDEEKFDHFGDGGGGGGGDGTLKHKLGPSVLNPPSFSYFKTHMFTFSGFTQTVLIGFPTLINRSSPTPSLLPTS